MTDDANGVPETQPGQNVQPRSSHGMYRSFRFRIYPTKSQVERLIQWEGALRWLWNIALEQRLTWQSRPRDIRRYPTYPQQRREMTLLRKDLPWLADAPCRACENTIQTLDAAWRATFSGRSKQPRFKSRHRAPVGVELDARNVVFQGQSLRLPKLGQVKAVVHRAMVGRTVSATIKRDADRWFVCFTNEVDAPIGARLPGTVGIDRGVVATADSNGRLTKAPRYDAVAQRSVARLQRSLSNKQRGSKNRIKAKDRLARARRRVRGQRSWFLHQLSHDYAKNHGVVVIEKLSVKNMTRSARGTAEVPGQNVRQKSGLNRGILDAAWSKFADALRYKLADRGGELVEVPAAYSSQTCSSCGHIAAESRRSQSVFCCVACGHSENADINAARIILSRWSPPTQPVEASLWSSQ